MEKYLKDLLMIVILLVAFLFIASYLPAADKTVQPSLTWDSKDASGKIETSMPVTINLYDSATSTLKSTISVNGPVTNQVMPIFVVTIPDNQDTTLSYYATARDAAGNISAKSTEATVVIHGKDTIAPGTPVLTIQIGP